MCDYLVCFLKAEWLLARKEENRQGFCGQKVLGRKEVEKPDRQRISWTHKMEKWQKTHGKM